MKRILAGPGDCTGCGVCRAVCGKGAVSMVRDTAGFPHPSVDEEKCIGCGACENACPVLHTPAPNAILECLAAWAGDGIRKESSSGGIFTALAEAVIEKGGCVCGVELVREETGFYARHIAVSQAGDLGKLRGSKYIQGRTDGIYEAVREALKQGKPVLFSGTPCEVAALRNYVTEGAENLYTAEVLCKGFLSESMLNEYVQEEFREKTVHHILFRDKERGWRADQFTAVTDGGKEHKVYPDSALEHVYHTNSALRHSCYHCPFSGRQRQADLSLGDFWGIEWFDRSWNDGKGTSLILVNTEKGRMLLKEAEKGISRIQPVPVRFAEANRLHENQEGEERRERFDLYRPRMGFSEAAHMVAGKKYDIGLVGCWSVENYGSNLTYYALYRLLTAWGYSVLMVERPETAAWRPNRTPVLFAENPYPDYALAPIYRNKWEMTELNDQCGTFVLGSDQLFYHDLYQSFDDFASLPFVFNDRKKIAVAASVGRDSFEGTEWQKERISLELGRFQAVSVREESAVALFRDAFGVDAQWVLDPVFLCDKAVYEKLAGKADAVSDKPYIAAYILDPDPAKFRILRSIADRTGLPVFILSDAAMDWDSGDGTIVRIRNNETWLRAIRDCDYMITDSFHGTCFSIIFEKQFISLMNRGRGESRFRSLLAGLGCPEQLVIAEEAGTGDGFVFPAADYRKIRPYLDRLADTSREWLKRNLDEPYRAAADANDLLKKDISALSKEIGRNADRSLNSEKWLGDLDRDLRTTQVSMVGIQQGMAGVQQEVATVRQETYNLAHDYVQGRKDVDGMISRSDEIADRVGMLEQRLAQYEERIAQLESVNSLKLKLHRARE